jgi:hypothetical protein
VQHFERTGFGRPGVRGDWLTVDGERFFVVGIGYDAGCRPGQLPWQRTFDRELLSHDFRRIREAGFNTLRVWGPLKDEELALAREFGLWVIQGLWFDPKADFNDPGFRSETYALVEREVRRMAKFDNILYYLLLNEPHGDAAQRVGVAGMHDFYAGLLEHARRAAPGALFSYANCVFTDYLSWDGWDVASYNVYPYSPAVIDKSLGYAAYLKWLKAAYAGEMPLVITEFGLSVSPSGDGRGYGGNSLEQQRDGVLQMWEDIIAAGCSGGCAFMWIDGWWKHGNEHAHDDHAEEWYGLLSADEDAQGEPRPVYYALKEYNRVIRLEPRPLARVEGDGVAVEVWVTDETVTHVEARRIPGGNWRRLTRRSYALWAGELDFAGCDEGVYTVETRGVTGRGDEVSVKRVSVVVQPDTAWRGEQIRVSFEGLSHELWRKDVPYQPLRIFVSDGNGRPLAGQEVRVATYFHPWWEEFDGLAQTDEHGIASIACPLPAGAGMLSVAAAVSNRVTGKISGDYRHVMLWLE